MKTVFQFREGCHLHGDAQAVGERLESIRAKQKALTPEIVLSDARSKNSPLHEFFEWDDGRAAERYRIDQAGHLIRSIAVTFEESEPLPDRQVKLSGVEAAPASAPRAVRAFLPIKSDAGESSYVGTREAMSDPGMRRQVLERAHMEMTAVGRKYRELQELSGVFNALDQVEAQLRDHQRQPA
jgi:hypothetical protein